MKNTRYGPSGALVIQSTQRKDAVHLKLLFFLASAIPLIARMQFCGRARRLLDESAIGAFAEQELDLMQPEGDSEAFAICERLQRQCDHNLRPWETSLAISRRLLSKLRYMNVQVGNPGATATEDWHRLPETILLEVAKSDWGLGSSSGESLLYLMTRENAAQRLTRLRETHRILQSNRDCCADALYDLFHLLIGGKDLDLMTGDLEDEPDDK